MAGKFTLPANGDPYQWDKLYQIGGAANGLTGWGRIWNLASLDDDSNYLLTLRNLGTGGHVRVLRSSDAAVILSMTDTTFTVIDTTIAGGLTVNNNLIVKGNASLGDAAGDAHVLKGTVNVQHAADFDSTLNVDGAVTFGTTLNVTGLTTSAGLTSSGDITLTGTVASGQGFQLRGTTTRHRLASVDLGAGSTLPIGVYFGATQRFGFETDGSVVVSTNNVGYSGTESGGTVRNLAKVDGGNILQYGVSGATGSVVEAAYVQLKSNGTVRFSVDTTGLGFFGTAPSAKAAVTGAKGGNVALANLLTELAAKGLITDSTT